MTLTASKTQEGIQRRSRRWRPILVSIIALSAILLVSRSAYTDLRAAGLLLRIEDPQHAGRIGRIHTYPIRETLTELHTPVGAIRARIYDPVGLADPPGMVVVHGVHHLGIDEPRLVAFARALSSSGIRVLTPELPALADYQVEPHSIDLIGASAREFAQGMHQKVGVLGISFGGGLSLIAAANPQYERFIRFVVSVGAHDDLERVSYFFINNRIARPDASVLQMQAHEYGPLVLIYSHVEHFFPPADLPAARDALRWLLWENVEESRKQAERLGPEGRATMELLYKHQVEPLTEKIRQVIAAHRADMAAVSPDGRLKELKVPVLLLHGAGDNVIPPTEMLWLERDVRADDLKASLTTPVLSHVSMDGKPTWRDNLALVRFMAKMLELVDDRQACPPRPMT